MLNQSFRHGFSLIEMVVLISIIGVVTMITMPLIQNYQPTLRLNTASRNLATDLRYAQQRTVTEQTNYQIAFDLPNRTYQVIKKATGQIIKTVTISNDLNWSINQPGFTNDRVEFVITGAALQAGQLVITNRQNRFLTIEIKPSGYVKISQTN
ncbi:MAG: prepilin-type N-terminal cleavage/methylation domain-containing protein [Candidatus Buchananbacteria bacterium]